MQIKYKEQYLIIKPNKRFYIADFYLEDFHTLIELDGKHHYTEEGVIKDVIRDNSLQELGFKKILRFENKDIFKLTEETITQCLKN
jgi:very-short-patch-repair endonuclease